jgi:hypothetical protein
MRGCHRGTTKWPDQHERAVPGDGDRRSKVATPCTVARDADSFYVANALPMAHISPVWYVTAGAFMDRESVMRFRFAEVTAVIMRALIEECGCRGSSQY